jgi:uncharacterized membrane protein
LHKRKQKAPTCGRRATILPFNLRAGVVVAAALLVLSLTSPAQAEFKVCNQTLDVVNVAIGHLADGEFTTEGWWTIGSNACAAVIREDLTVRHIFVYATDVFGQPLLSGTEPMCIGEDRFKIAPGTGDCWARSYREENFYDVDTQATNNWTLFLTEP